MACDLRKLTRETRCVVDGAKQSRDVMWFSGSDVKTAVFARSAIQTYFITCRVLKHCVRFVVVLVVVVAVLAGVYAAAQPSSKSRAMCLEACFLQQVISRVCSKPRVLEATLNVFCLRMLQLLKSQAGRYHLPYPLRAPGGR